jgi:hypothetical protein
MLSRRSSFSWQKCCGRPTRRACKSPRFESKMLYFTEVHPSPEVIREGNAEFECDDDAGEYENKVAQLVQNARARSANISPSQEHDWNGAFEALKKEDHYILVMVGLAFGYGASSGTRPCVRHFLMYICIGIALVLFLVLTTFWWATH